jgi:Sulfotransferase family
VNDFALTFGVESLLAEARQRTEGLEDLGPGPFLEPLKIFVDSLENEAMLNPVGQYIAKERALQHIANRLLYTNDRKRYPAIADEKITKPVFIIGFPRTGTTILHDILAQDPANRAPLTWEVNFPSPPPMAATFDTDPRIEKCEATFPPEDQRRIAFKAMHPMGARLSQECVVMMGDAMCTPLFHNQFRVPTYQDWVDHDADWAPVYAFHRQQLQHLQWRHHGDRWVLKTGAHMWGLECLLETYPDARIVFTHRDPVKSLTSYSSLTALVHSMGSDHVDRQEITDDWIARLKRVIDHAMRVRTAKEYPDAIFYDMYFPDFVRDQFAAVENIYRALDLPMSDDGARRMRAFIADNPKGKHGIHRYEPEEFGVKPELVRDIFRSYIEHFDLRAE